MPQETLAGNVATPPTAHGNWETTHSDIDDINTLALEDSVIINCPEDSIGGHVLVKDSHWVIDTDSAVEQYIDKYGAETIDVPETYSGIREMVPVVTEYSFARNRIGAGITPEGVEAGVRLHAGDGRFTGEYTIHVTHHPENRFVILETPDGYLFINHSSRSIDAEDSPRVLTPETTISLESHSVSVPFIVPERVEAMKKTLETLEQWFDVTITEYVGQTGEQLEGFRFQTAENGVAVIHGRDVTKLTWDNVRFSMDDVRVFDENHSVTLTTGNMRSWIDQVFIQPPCAEMSFPVEIPLSVDADEMWYAVGEQHSDELTDPLAGTVTFAARETTRCGVLRNGEAVVKAEVPRFDMSVSDTGGTLLSLADDEFGVWVKQYEAQAKRVVYVHPETGELYTDYDAFEEAVDPDTISMIQ